MTYVTVSNSGVYFNKESCELLEIKELDRLWFDFHSEYVTVFKSKYGSMAFFTNKSKNICRVRESTIRKNIQVFYNLPCCNLRLILEPYKDFFIIKPIKYD